VLGLLLPLLPLRLRLRLQLRLRRRRRLLLLPLSCNWLAASCLRNAGV